MSRRNLLGLSAAFVAAVCLVGSYARSQDKHAHDNKAGAGAAAGGMDEAAMKAMMEAGTPGPQHKALEPMAEEMCKRLQSIDRIDDALEYRLPEGGRLDLLRVGPGDKD